MEQGSRRVCGDGKHIALSRKGQTKYGVIHRAETGITTGVPAEQAGDRTYRRWLLWVVDVPELNGSLAGHCKHLAIGRELDITHI